MIKKIIISSFLILFYTHTFAQKIKDFGEDIENYPQVIESMFPTNLGEEEKALISQFNDNWNNGTFTNSDKEKTILLSNVFLQKKARNIHYLAMWRCLLAFKSPENTSKGYDQWMSGMIASGQNRRITPTTLQNIMTATLNLLEKQIICASAGSEWKTRGDDYRFVYSNDELTVNFGTTDVYCFSKGDSIMIGQTTGHFNLSDQLWKGKGGTVNWERAGYTPDEIMARLNTYRIDMKKSEYVADSVWLTHKTYFPSPVLGKLIDRVRHNQSPETAIYPEFITYNQKFVFEDIYPDISYEGGLKIQGARIIGSGTDDEKASIRITKGDSINFNIFSKSFVFRSDRINARKVSVSIHMKGDSIYHSNLSFAYLVDNNEISLLRTDEATSQAPYSDSYHKVEMDFEQLIWKTDEPLIYLSMGRGAAVGRARFRSQNYFDERYFEQMQYFDAVHPLIAIRRCAASYSEVFTSEEYATFIKRPLATARAQLIEIAKLGFITYDGDKDEVTIQPRLYEFLSAAAKKSDFDVIDLQSIVQSPEKNATLDAKNFDLILNGVEKFMVSDSQAVVISPVDKKVLMTKDRNMYMKGQIDAGQLELYGDSLHFDYGGFKIEMVQVDSLFMYVPSGERDVMGKPILKKVKNSIQKLSGSILIDEPDNKSGLKNVPRYPILRSDSTSKVLYGAADIEGGAYKNDAFFFEIDPFVLDSIDNFGKEAIVLPGHFSSADIFKDMRQALKIQPDYSLGFIYETGDSAISAYKDAKLLAEVRLSNKGLQASGQLDYLTASIHTDDFKIYPDSLNVPSTKEFILRQQTNGTEFPQVSSVGNRIHWEPKHDKMYIYKYDQNFNMYNPETGFDGNLLLTPGGLSGDGRVDMKQADIRSDKINFNAKTFSSDTAVFRLKGTVEGSYQLATVDSVKSFVDFDKRKGHFVPLKDHALIRFPMNKYAAFIDEFSWDMDSSTISIGVDTLVTPLKAAADFRYKFPGEGKGTRYYSTAREADSLNFVASSAVFDHVTGRLKADGVKIIQSADALIYPSDGKVTIGANGNMESIHEARIVFDSQRKQHVVHLADINIMSRKRFSGRGRYDYIDETGKISEIEITSIAPDQSGKTVAKGKITEDELFMLSPFYRYQGDVSLSSDTAFMSFNGAIQIVEECDAIRPEWVSFKAVIDPNNITIPVSSAPVNINNNKIYNGLFLTNDSTHIYPAFFSKRKNYSDNQLINAEGVLYYDKEAMIYHIMPEKKITDRELTGNVISFDRDKCIFNGEGKLSLGVDLGRVKTEMVGEISHNMNNNETTMEVMLAFDFLFDDGLAAMIASKIDSFPTLAGIDMLNPRYIKGMNEWLGTQKATTFRRDALMGKVKNFPEELKHTLVLSELKMKWNPATRSYQSTGKIGVGNLSGHQVNRMVEGVVEISKRPGGDFLDIYLKLDNNNWFYFGYTRELMQVISSDQAFNDRLVKLPEKQRKSGDKRPGYTYMIASSDKLNQFLKQNQMDGTPAQTAPAQDISSPVIPNTPREIQKSDDDVPIVEIE